jgi:hypothetical protein
MLRRQAQWHDLENMKSNLKALFVLGIERLGSVIIRMRIIQACRPSIDAFKE